MDIQEQSEGRRAGGAADIPGVFPHYHLSFATHVLALLHTDARAATCQALLTVHTASPFMAQHTPRSLQVDAKKQNCKDGRL